MKPSYSPGHTNTSCRAAHLYAIVPLALLAQQPLTPTFRTNVDVVQVDVSVLDKHRNRHSGRALPSSRSVKSDAVNPRTV